MSMNGDDPEPETAMPPRPVHQAAAIPVRDGRVCLVTSRGGRRWVVPKGRIEPGQTAGEAALTEAWEEAGLVGALTAEPLGSYHYEKFGLPHHVTVFVLAVTGQHDDWPERAERRREWVSIPVARGRVEEPGLRDLLRLLRRAVGRPATSV
jgi:8-oxo-dGTP pyrophosphatase MutT (NUDIX family)